MKGLVVLAVEICVGDLELVVAPWRSLLRQTPRSANLIGDRSPPFA